MLNFTLTDYDRQVYEKELKNFLPDEFFDFHTHINKLSFGTWGAHNGGSTWTSLGIQSGAIATKTYTFTVPDGTESIMIKLVHASSNSKNTRVDNLVLKVN